ncbi:MAG: hypothetical protein QXP27_03825 [Candidatus Methanomethyliaceae archaeon]
MTLPDWPRAPGPDVEIIECRDVRAIGNFLEHCLGYERFFWADHEWFTYKPFGEVAYGFTITLVPRGSIVIEGCEETEEKEPRAKLINSHRVPDVEEVLVRCLNAGMRIPYFTVRDPK